jgi:trk system potassium uptake protein TrkA
MRVVIVGCGRVGASLAAALDAAGHRVLILDQVTAAFDRLPTTFSGEAVRGDGTDEDTLRRAGADGADYFFALTEGDNRNIMAAQIARESLGIHSSLAKINDPVRARAYADLGVATMCRTTLMTDALLESVGLAGSGDPVIHAASEHEHPSDVQPGAAVGSGSAGSAIRIVGEV